MSKPHDPGCAWADLTSCPGSAEHQWYGYCPSRCQFCFIEHPDEQCLDNMCGCWCHDDEDERTMRLLAKLKDNRETL